MSRSFGIVFTAVLLSLPQVHVGYAQRGENTEGGKRSQTSHESRGDWDSSDLDYQSFFKHIPEDQFPAARDMTKWIKEKAREYLPKEIDYPTGEENARTYRFDMGPPDGPVKEGYTRITKDDLFSWEKGFGWSTERAAGDFTYSGKKSQSVQKNMDYATVQVMPLYDVFEKHNKELTSLLAGSVRWKGHEDTWEFYDTFLDDMSRDVVLNPDELAFKVALPDGRYLVSMIIGDLQIPRYAMEIYANGQLITSNKYTGMVQFRGTTEPATPWLARVSFPVEVVRNNIRIALRANDNLYRERMEASAEPALYNYTQMGQKKESKKEIRTLTFWGKRMALHGPATQMALAGLTITPYKEPPLELIRQHLFVHKGVTDGNAIKGAEMFNAGALDAAETHFDKIPASETILKASSYMALAGLLDVSLIKEATYVKKALDVLEKGRAGNPEDILIEEMREVAHFYDQGLYRMIHASARPLNQVRVEAVALFKWVQPHDILFSKSLSHIGRCYAQTDPHRWVTSWYLAEEAFLELEEREPGNKISGYYLYRNLDGWDLIDYSQDVEGAPKWAALIYEAYNRVIDQIEWWGQNQQLPDGRLGGGWGDDVELGAVWETILLANPDASPIMRETVKAIAEGVWWSGEIDREAGFYDGLADVEHTAEYVGHSQPMMLGIEHGNPIYFERCLKSGKLMRDLWTGITPKGHRHFKSMMIGNKEVGTEYWTDAEIDHPLNGRAAYPALWTWWHSNGDELDRIFTEWAEAWLEDCKRVENGKLEWVMPGPIGYHDDVLGGNGAEVWKSKASGYLQPGYPGYLSSIFSRMYVKTGDPVWLRPRMLILDKKEDRYREVANPLEPRNVVDKYEFLIEDTGLEGIIESIRDRWPSLTSEVASTDRAAPPEIGRIRELLTGGHPLAGFDFMPVTFENMSRKVAFLTLGSSRSGARTLFYNFNENEEPAHMKLWQLQVGGEYQVTAGVDTNDDDRIDSLLKEFSYVHKHRGDSVGFTIPPGTAVVVEIEQIKPGKGMPQRVVDLAMAPEDIEYSDGSLSVTVHNIGNKNCDEFSYQVWQGGVDTGKLLDTIIVDGLEAPNDMEPRSINRKVKWQLPKTAAVEKPIVISVVVDPKDKYYEITEQNNVVSRSFPYKRKAYMVPRMWRTFSGGT
ncbi:CARDB domain-containing protein [Candidatus Hydrogenedentota bacterium]